MPRKNSLDVHAAAGPRSGIGDAPVVAHGGISPLATVPEAALIARVSPRSIWAALARGDLAAVRLGPRTTRIEISSIQAWIARSKTRAAR